ncbi:MAG TPA: aminoacyl-tRNA hydrolase [Candidatus Coprovivens excrementavium]|nr:aminoacyl-tRNA hydrolase [Candidatus Coprovivens excrementavium]
MKLIIGLGNPGKDYQNTRHNVGFLILDNYLGNVDWKEKFNALYFEKRINNEKVIFVKPLTFMNLSGNAVVKYVNYYNVNIDDILVIQDDLDLPFSTYKLKKNSSAGGHNGIKSIINCLCSQDFLRLKIGVSNNKSIDTKDYVLGRFSKEEKDKLDSLQKTFNEIIESFVIVGISKTMNIYNTKK